MQSKTTRQQAPALSGNHVIVNTDLKSHYQMCCLVSHAVSLLFGSGVLSAVLLTDRRTARPLRTFSNNQMEQIRTQARPRLARISVSGTRRFGG
jgi:hypothetical protein